MARTIRLQRGGYVTRYWGGDGFRFEIHSPSDIQTTGFSVILPTPQEMLDIGALFRRAGLKMRTRESTREKKTPGYETSTLTYLGQHDKDCSRVNGDGGVCDCGAEGE